MPSTTNFGWTTPADTDLVKDGASAIRTLGNGIDTTLVDLKGGTTGQVLSKNSNTDMDFTWVAQDDSNAIQNAIVDAKGDLISATAADTPARLAVGTNGQVLTADSTQSTGLAWTTISSGGMTLLSTTTLSGATTTISSISGSYNALEIHIYGVTNATANGNFYIAPNGSTTITTQRVWGMDGNGGTTGAINEQDTYLRLNSSPTSNIDLLRTSSANYYIIQIYNYAQSSYDKVFQVNGMALNTASLDYSIFGFGRINTTSAISSLVFSNSGGNLSTGTVLIYGVK